MADYNKFGRLIKINGGTSDASIQAAWAKYLSNDGSAVRVAGNIVFADLHAKDASAAGLYDESRQIDASTYPAGYYIYANGVEYKVANLEQYEEFYHRFEDYEHNTNASIDEIQRWQNEISFHLANNKITIDDNGNSSDGKGPHIKGFVNFDSKNYVDVYTGDGAVDSSSDASTIYVRLRDDMITVSSSTADNPWVSGKKYSESSDLVQRGYVDERLDTIDTSVKDLSARILSRLTDARLTVEGNDTYNDVSFGLYTKKETNHTDGTYVETLMDEVHLKGDSYVTIAAGTKVDKNTEIKFTLTPWNASLDGVPYDNASLAVVGKVRDYVDRKVQGLTGALRFMGGVKSADDLNNVRKNIEPKENPGDPDVYVDSSKGCLWVSNASFNYVLPVTGGEQTIYIEPGDQIILTADASKSPAVVMSPITVVERNLDGVVTANDRSFTEGNLIVGNRDGKQDVKDSGYTVRAADAAGTNDGNLDEDTSTDMIGSERRLATEYAVATYVEKMLNEIDVTVDSSAPKYLNINIDKHRGNIQDMWDISVGVNVTSYTATTAATDENSSTTTLADAATFKKAIQNITGVFAVGEGENFSGIDSSVVLAVQMPHGNTSIGIKGGEYVQLTNVNSSLLRVDIKNSLLKDASDNFEGLAIASDVSARIIEVEQTVATAIAQVKDTVGLDEDLGITWTGEMKNAFGEHTVVKTAIEALNTSFRNASIHLNNRIDSLNVEDTDTAGKIVVGVTEEKGFVRSIHSDLKINGNAFNHDVGEGLVSITLDAVDISVGGTDTRWKAKKVNEAIYDLSTWIENVSLKCVDTITSLNPACTSTNTNTYIDGNYIQLNTTRDDSKTPNASNNYNLDVSLALVKTATPIATDHVEVARAGLVTNDYVHNEIENTLAWENY